MARCLLLVTVLLPRLCFCDVCCPKQVHGPHICWWLHFCCTGDMHLFFLLHSSWPCIDWMLHFCCLGCVRLWCTLPRTNSWPSVYCWLHFCCLGLWYTLPRISSWPMCWLMVTFALCRLCAFVMHTAQNKFMAHVFHCEPSAGPLCKTIEAACKVMEPSDVWKDSDSVGDNQWQAPSVVILFFASSFFKYLLTFFFFFLFFFLSLLGGVGGTNWFQAPQVWKL